MDKYGMRTCEFCSAILEPTWIEGFRIPGRCDCAEAEKGREERRQEIIEWKLREQERRFEKIKESMGLKGALKQQTFESFWRDLQPQAYDEALSFFDNPHSIVFLGEPYGIGKTHLAAAIANRCLENGLRQWGYYGENGEYVIPKERVIGGSVKFTTLADLLQMIRDTYDDGAAVSTRQVMEGLEQIFLLCIDDVGKEALSSWAEEKLFQVIDKRYTQRPAGYLVMTSNVTGRNLAEHVGYHNWSRLQEVAIFVEMKGRDYRLTNRE